MLLPSIRFDLPFACVDSTGLPTAPTGTPTGTLVKNGTDLGTTVTVTMTSAQGIASCTIPADAVAGDRFYIRISAVISAVTFVLPGPSVPVVSPVTLAAVTHTGAVVPTVSVLTGHTAQTGDTFARLGVNGAGLTSLASQADATAIKTKTDTLPASFPMNFATLGINATGHISRVTLVDTTTTNTDMRGTNSANTTTPPTAAAVATQVRTELATELARVDVATSTRLATTNYTDPTSPPTVAAIASQVRSELATELARVDVAISSRAAPGVAMSLTTGERLTLAGAIEAGFLDDLTGGAFLAGIQSQIQAILDSNTDVPVSTIAAAVATAVRTNLATELARLDAAVSTRLATTSYTSPPSVAGLATSASVSSLLTYVEALPVATEIASQILIDPTRRLLTDNSGHVTATNSGGSGNVNNATFVMPLRSTSLERVQANRIDLFVRERVLLSMTITDAQKQPVNCDGLTCSLFIEGGIEIPDLLPSASTLGGAVNRYTFTPPEEMTATPATLWFGLRVSDTTERVLAFGHIVVAEVP